MKIISIDIGIKNLAFCLFEKSSDSTHFKITKWDIINISESGEILKCCFDNNNCKSVAKFKKDTKCYCAKHAKKQLYQIPTSELKISYLSKQTIQKLYDIADKYSIKYEKPIKKTNLLNLIHEYIHTNYFQEIEKVDATKIGLINVGENIKTKLNSILLNEECIDYVIIENQISPIAMRMKTIQGMIVQYFIMCGINVNHIEFISSVNKLKEFNKVGQNKNINNDLVKNLAKDKIKYGERKKLSIDKCLEIISSDYRFSNWADHFKSHTKKDDLSDTFLQGLWYINHHNL
jgi:hypothetical protein